MSPASRRCRASVRRAAATLLVAVGLAVAVAAPAAAHVSVMPGKAPKGSSSVLSFSVPNESQTASTVAIEVTFPVDHPIASVSVLPLPGWKWSAERTTLAKPIETEDEQVTEAVSKITWTGGAIAPGEFQLFTVSVGPLPTNTKKIDFKVVQTYSDGEIVRWIEPTPKGGPEPDHPAPRLKLVGKAKSD